ncbi:hypothetical protein [Candidatus Poriferisodalis sp.]|uniref:hypothetical protein n=1 Tax=Candidatus Poriferisodalis sp. TaxID=3101277 RepID=UPI003B01BFE0
MALLTAGCVEATWNVVANDDGSGSFEWRYVFDDNVVGLDAGSDDAAMRAGCLQFIRRFEGVGSVQPRIPGVETLIQSRHGDGRCSYVATTSWSADESDKVFDALAEDGGPKFRRITGGGWGFDFDTSFIDDYWESGGLPFRAADVLQPTFTLSLTLPGVPLGHNADSVEGTTLVWIVDLTEPDDIPRVLRAETTGPSGGTVVPLIGGVLFAILVVFLARAKWRRRQAR